MRKILLGLIVLLCSVTLRAQAVIQSTGASCNNCNSLNITFGSNMTTGHGQIINCGHSGPLNGALTFSDTLGNSYSGSNGGVKSRGDAQGGGRFTFDDVAYECGNSPGGADTITASAGASTEGSITCTIQEVSNISASNCLDQSSNSGCAGGCGTSAVLPGITTTSATEFLEAAAWEEADGSTAPSNSSYTQRIFQYDGTSSPATSMSENADKSVSSTGTYANTFTWASGAGTWEGWNVSFFSGGSGTATGRRKIKEY